MKRNKGITLITLVITIIVLIILAGVSINLVLGENGIITRAKYAKEEYKLEQAKEELEIEILQVQTIILEEEGRTATLEDLQSLIDTFRYEIILHYEPIVSSKIITQKSTYAEVKEIESKIKFIVDNKLIIKEVTIEDSKETIKEVPIDLELENLLKEANMSITLEDVLNTPAIMNNMEGLIPTLTENDVTRSEVDGIITYTDNKGGIIRTNSEHSSYYTWYAFDDNSGTYSVSALDKANGYYVEYDFQEEVYAMKVKYRITNTSAYEGTRVMAIQGYNEDNGEWENLSADKTLKGKNGTFPEVVEDINFEKPYKKYRLYTKNSTYTSDVGGGRVTGILEMQLYGAVSTETNSKEKLKKLLLTNFKGDKITLNDMVTNLDFTQRLVNALSIETIENNETLMNNLPGLIPTLTENDVTRSEVDGIITYTDNKGGIIRTNSEHSSYYTWYAFDNNSGTKAVSALDKANGYYVEYDFQEEVYAMKVKYRITNTSAYEGTRVMAIQGYNEDNGEWENLSADKTLKGKNGTFPEVVEDINFEKPYKRYRLYTKSSTYTSNSAGGRVTGIFEMQLYGKK